jgi:hypothetical protein
MKLTRASKAQVAVILFAAASFIAGCNSGSGTVPGTSQTQANRIRHLTLAATTVKVFNDENLAITGTATTPTCWTVSPTPIPSVAPNGHTGIITETFDTTCASGAGMVLEYSLGPYFCDFTTTYQSGAFSYQAMGNDGNCFATPAPSDANYNEKFTYGIILGPSKKAPHAP